MPLPSKETRQPADLVILFVHPEMREYYSLHPEEEVGRWVWGCRLDLLICTSRKSYATPNNAKRAALDWAMKHKYRIMWKVS